MIYSFFFLAQLKSPRTPSIIIASLSFRTSHSSYIRIRSFHLCEFNTRMQRYEKWILSFASFQVLTSDQHVTLFIRFTLISSQNAFLTFLTSWTNPPFDSEYAIAQRRKHELFAVANFEVAQQITWSWHDDGLLNVLKVLAVHRRILSAPIHLVLFRWNHHLNLLNSLQLPVHRKCLNSYVLNAYRVHVAKNGTSKPSNHISYHGFAILNYSGILKLRSSSFHNLAPKISQSSLFFTLDRKFINLYVLATSFKSRISFSLSSSPSRQPILLPKLVLMRGLLVQLIAQSPEFEHTKHAFPWLYVLPLVHSIEYS